VSIEDRTLLQWLDEPPTGRGLHFSGSANTWAFWPYAELAALTLRTAAALSARRLRGGVVVIIQRSSPGLVASLFGTLAAGATACSVAPPFAFRRSDEHERHLSHLLATAQPALVITDTDSISHLQRLTGRLGLSEPLLFDELIADVVPTAGPAPPAELALLQFTSGSTGFSRAVRVPNSAVQANATAMRRWLHWTPEFSGISWLPMHHDMGLIGCLLNIVVTGCDGWMMQPEEFIRSPLRYLSCISAHRVALTAMPNFGLAYILRRVRPASLEGLRFDSLRSVILGAERTDPRILEGIERLLEPFGFDRRAILPAYGSAEATLAVTGLPMHEGWITAAPRRNGRVGRRGAEIVGCGRPLEGISVSVIDDNGLPVRDGTVGEILVTGPSVAAGYLGDPGTVSVASLRGGTLRTGDAGFLTDGQLFVLGRLGDGLKVRGGMVFAEGVEAMLAHRGIPARHVVVLLGVRDGCPTAAVLLENAQPDWAVIADEVLRESVGDAELLVMSVPRGGIALTSSGKPRRRLMWRALCDGTLAGDVVAVPAHRSHEPAAGVGTR